MAEQLASYVPDEVVVIISQASTGISERVVGFMDGTFVEVTRDAESWTHVTGVDDFATRVHNANSSGKITLSLMQTSPSNDVLSAIWRRDNTLKNNAGLFSIIVKDGSGRSLDQCSEAYVSVYPDRAFSNGVEGRQWVISCPKLASNIGGNSLVSAETVDSLNKLESDIPDFWKQ